MKPVNPFLGFWVGFFFLGLIYLFILSSVFRRLILLSPHIFCSTGKCNLPQNSKAYIYLITAGFISSVLICVTSLDTKLMTKVNAMYVSVS